MWGGNVVLEEERERTSISPANRGLESSADRMEGPRLPEAYGGGLGFCRQRIRRRVVYPNDDDVFED